MVGFFKFIINTRFEWLVGIKFIRSACLQHVTTIRLQSGEMSVWKRITALKVSLNRISCMMNGNKNIVNVLTLNIHHKLLVFVYHAAISIKMLHWKFRINFLVELFNLKVNSELLRFFLCRLQSLEYFALLENKKGFTIIFMGIFHDDIWHFCRFNLFPSRLLPHMYKKRKYISFALGVIQKMGMQKLVHQRQAPIFQIY